MTPDPTFITATRVRRRWRFLLISVTVSGESHVVEYWPWEISESVSVDGLTVVRRRGGSLMSHSFCFPLGNHWATLSIAVPWWGELVPLRPSFVRLEVD